MSLEKKKIVLGITGGIAAFKAASIASQLRKQGAEVKCIMTDHATKLITPLTMREISGNPVAVSMFDDVPEFNVEHIALARWADVFVIAPATADIIGKIANGIADDMLSTTVMATTAPVLIAPAMNTNMYLNPITQDNMAKLKKFGYHFIEPDTGHLACGIDGVGRLRAAGLDLILGAVPAVPEATDEHTGAYLEPSARGIAERVARLWDELSFPRIDLVDHVDVTVDRGIASAPTDWVAPAYAGGRRAAELISRAAGDL